MKQISIVFFGAGPVAAKSLEMLQNHVNIEAVITKNKPAHHKGESPVYDLAEKLNIPIITAANRLELDTNIASQHFTSRIGVLIDFGIIVSEEVISTFPLGIVNSHFSLLPEWRGADPITYSLLSGQKATGVSLMLLAKGMDEGPILTHGQIQIEDTDTGITLTQKLITLSNTLLLSTLEDYVADKIIAVDQIEYAKNHGLSTSPTYSSKLSKNDGLVAWNKSADEIERAIRAYQPWPKSYCSIGKGLDITILEASIYPEITLEPGAIKAENNRLLVGTRTCALELKIVQPAGRKPMAIGDFLRGNLNKLFVRVP